MSESSRDLDAGHFCIWAAYDVEILNEKQFSIDWLQVGTKRC
jgi:hypothetical protein